jgi:hypothetical protein
MRLSTDKGDAGFPAFAALVADGKRVTVMLDGVEMSDVETCDDAAGEIVRFAKDENGDLRLNETRDEILRETLRGVVTIVIAEG